MQSTGRRYCFLFQKADRLNRCFYMLSNVKNPVSIGDFRSLKSSFSKRCYNKYINLYIYILSDIYVVVNIKGMILLNECRKNGLRTTLDKKIVIPSLFIILVTVIGCMVSPKQAGIYLSQIKNYIFAEFSWVYILSVSFFLVFLLILSVGRLGDIRLGDEDEKPEFSFFSWVAMLFAAGMGIGLMYFGVAEPILHYSNPLDAEATTAMHGQEAMLNTLFHWGIHAWAVYGIIGLSLAYFGFRYRLPLTIRSGFYPILKTKINGFWGDVIDIVALCATIFGLTTTLGYGALQLNAGLQSVTGYETESFLPIAILIVLAVTMAVISAISGVGRGIRLLSQGNLMIAGALMLFVLFTGPTVHIMSAFSENTGYYISHLVDLSFRTFAYEPGHKDWFTSWTIVYWAWWISWAPFVGLFIAKISRGRTVREFVLCVLVVPTVFNILWMTIFGNSAIWLDSRHGGALSALAGQTERMLFQFLQMLPLSTLTSVLALMIIAIFFVTSADSGIFVINSIASYGKTKFPRWQSVMWGTLMAMLAMVLLYSGGLDALQTMTVLMALPFALIMIILSFCLLKGMVIDNSYFSRGLTKDTSYWTGERWQERLENIVDTMDEEKLVRYMDTTVREAFTDIVSELKKYDITAEVRENLKADSPFIELVIRKDKLRNFVYGVAGMEKSISQLVVDDPSFPTVDTPYAVEPICYFSDGRRGYSIKYMRKRELITDVLRQYERYIRMASDVHHSLYLYDKD